MKNLVDTSDKFKILVDLVRSQIETDPFEHDGYLWAKDPQAWYCRELGVSAPTLRSYIKDCPELQPKRIRGKVLLRIGDPAPMSAYNQAQVMSKDWGRKLRELRNHPKHDDNKRRPYTTPAEFDRLLALAGKAWPTDKAPELFRMVLNHWGTFKAGCKARHAEHEAKTSADLEGLPFHHFPNIALICKYSDVALEMAAFPNVYHVPDIGLKAAA